MKPGVYEWTSSWALEKRLKIWASPEAGSTNTIAKDDTKIEIRPHLAAGELVSAPTLYLTQKQVQGRGRGDHVWTMAEGSSICSWSFAVARVPQPIFSALVGLALYEAALGIWPEIAFNVKAPNDLFIERLKTAGILIETVDQGREKRTVIGVGFNVFAKPPALDTATCLADHTRNLQESDWRSFLDSWSQKLETAVREGLNERLSMSATERLKVALNRHPLLKEPILRVDDRGQLHSASRIVHWHEL